MIEEVKPKASMVTGRGEEGVAATRTRQRATTLHCVKARRQSPWRYSWRGEATHALISGGGAVLHSVAMSWKAVFAVVSHLSRRSLLRGRVNITNETYLFLVIAIAADGKQWQWRLWTMAAAVPAVVDSDCGWWLLTAAADDDDDSLRMKRTTAGSGRGGG